MFDLNYPDAFQQHSNNVYPKTSDEEVLAVGRLFIKSEPKPSDGDHIIAVALSLINIYDAPYKDHDKRDEAAKIVTELAMRYSSVLDLVIQNAADYSKGQCIDDADPYFPNSYGVLSRVGRNSERVVHFLERMVREESGILRSHSLAVLCALQA